jgi:SNF2 family DNA or RNA helicase
MLRQIQVYTQFLHFLRILARICQSENISYTFYHGGMSHEARNQAIVDFGSKENNKRIMLASLKSGGLGLNLTAASRVITVDPWWNRAIEDQCFGRVYRIGQEKETSLCRLLVRGTIDEKMEAIKKRKELEIDSLMNNKNLRESLGLRELLGLFGVVQDNSKGKPFIVANSEVQGNARQTGGDPMADRLNTEGTFEDDA